MDKEFLWTIIIWLIACILYFSWKRREEKKKEMIISKEEMKSYDKPLEMSIGERLRRGRKYEGRHRK